MKKQLALYEELLDDEGAIIEQNPVVIISGAELDDLRFALAPSVETAHETELAEGWPVPQ